jgi:hypothetical protein
MRVARGFDFAPLLAAVVLAFVILGSLQFWNVLPGGERGLLRFEKACPIYSPLAASDAPNASR